MTPAQMEKLDEIKRIFEAQNFADNAGKIGGSQTAQLGAGQAALSKIRQGAGFATMSSGPVSGAALHGLGAILQGQDQKIMAKLAEAMQDPAIAHQLMMTYGKGPTPQALAMKRAMQQIMGSSGAVGGAAIANE